MTLITLLVGLIVFAVAFAIVNAFGIPEPYRKIANLVIGLVFIVWLVSGLLGVGNLGNIRIGQ